MAYLRVDDLKAAFPEQPAALDLGRAIDDLGTGGNRNNGILELDEVERALAGCAKARPGSSAAQIATWLKDLLGPRATRTSAVDLLAQIATEKAAQGIREADLVADLLKLCKDPSLRRREARDVAYQ